MENIKTNLFKIIEERKITPYSVAVNAGVAPSDIYKYRESVPSLLTALRISKSLDLKLEDIWSLK